MNRSLAYYSEEFSKTQPFAEPPRKLIEHFSANLNQVLLQVLNFASVIATGLMIWKGLGVITYSESPIVVVLRYVASC